MKILFASMILALSVAANAGVPATLITNVKMSGNVMPGPGPARKVTSSITFVVETCKTVTAEDYKLNVATTFTANERSVSVVTLETNAEFDVDCFGSTHKSEVTLQTKEIPAYAALKLGNELLTKQYYVH